MADALESPLMTQVALVASDRPRYSKSELDAYFARIGLPSEYLESPVLSDPNYAKTKEHGLPFIHALTRYHACSVPFENLEIHYSLQKKITLDTTDLYAKFVQRRRGGRCMENNTFFGTVLRSLGFDVRNCAGRVARAMSPYPNVRRGQALTYDGWNHMLNLVRLDHEWYVVDVGMGAMGPNIPYPVQDGYEMTSIAPRKIRLQRRTIAETFSSPDTDELELPNLWCYDVCYNPGTGSENIWIPVYCFTTMEFLPQDYEMMSWFTSTHQRSFFTRFVICSKMVQDDDCANIIGNITLNGDTVQKTIGAKRELIKKCATEEERLLVLYEVFGVDLTDEEKQNILPNLRLA